VQHVVDFGERIAQGKGHITLYPSGHILGSAQALLEFNGERLVYTGDFKLKSSRTAEPCEVIPCDHLIMECTYGLPQYRFPDRAQVESDILSYLENVLKRNKVPVIFAYVLGRSQEILKLLAENGFNVALENRVFDMCRIYEELGVTFGEYERFDPDDHGDRILIFPPHLWKSPVVTRIRNRETVAVTGWAVDGRQQNWYSSDVAFPISDHADFDDLKHYIEQAGPSKVSLIHGFEEFAKHLEHMGLEVQVIDGIAH
jgi:Cft2 family RNA processing exonuclease